MTTQTQPPGVTLFLTDADVRLVFDWAEAAQALRLAYGRAADGQMFPSRTMARGDGLWLRTLSGIAPDGSVMGAKLIAASMKAKAVSYLIPLFDQSTTALSALIDGNAITGFRTAATSAVAADFLVPPGPLRVAAIGSGFEAKAHIRALQSLRPLERVVVFSPRASSRAGFIAALADLSISIEQANSAAEAVEGANLILCAARSRDESPTLRGEWLTPGSSIISIGSTLPEQRELDSEAIRRADLIVADMPMEVANDTGDMLAAKADGVSFADKLIGLDQLITGSRKGRTHPNQILIYKSVGGALQDLTVAAMCVQRAKSAGIGTRLPVSITPVGKGR